MLLEGQTPPSNTVKEVEWTICFNFPMGDVYPCRDGSYQEELDEEVMTWNDKKKAEDYAREKCTKYGWHLMPTVIECIDY